MKALDKIREARKEQELAKARELLKKEELLNQLKAEQSKPTPVMDASAIIVPKPPKPQGPEQAEQPQQVVASEALLCEVSLQILQELQIIRQLLERE